MKVLIFCSVDINLGSGSEVRARLIAEGLKHHGVDVGVVAPNVPDYFRNLKIPHYPLADYTNWSNDLTRAAQQFGPDIIYGITEAGTDTIMRVARSRGCLVAYDLHGIGVIEILELGRGYGSRIKRVAKSLKWLAQVPRADIVTVANPTLVPVIKLLNRQATPIIGMADISKFSLGGDIAQLGTDKTKLQVLYAGNFFKWQGTNLLLSAIEKLLLQDELFEFTLVGSVGRTKQFLRRWRRILDDPRVQLVDYVEFSKIDNYYRGADVLVIPRPFMLSTYLALPQKLADYMLSEKTIVATNLAPHRWALSNPESGILCSPTVQGIVSGIRQSQDSHLRTRLAHNARTKAVKQFCHIKQCKHIYDAFQNLITNQ